MKKEIDHSNVCAKNMVYKTRAGKCVFKSETESRDEPRDVPTKSLRFVATKGRVQGVPSEKKVRQ